MLLQLALALDKAIADVEMETEVLAVAEQTMRQSGASEMEIGLMMRQFAKVMEEKRCQG